MYVLHVCINLARNAICHDAEQTTLTTPSGYERSTGVQETKSRARANHANTRRKILPFVRVRVRIHGNSNEDDTNSASTLLFEVPPKQAKPV